MGKKVRYTGSKLLGEELRRLRGSRHLEEIAALSRASFFEGRLRPIAVPTLSQVENGISMPNLDTLQALALIYKVSAQRLLNIIAEDRLTTKVAPPEDLSEEAYIAELHAGRWDQALALAIHAERVATTERERAGWRVNRARAMHYLGMRSDAILLLMSALDSPHLDPAQRVKIQASLADVLASAGNLTLAADNARAALERAPVDAEPKLRLTLLETRIRLLILQAQGGVPSDGRGPTEVLELVRKARELPTAEQGIHSRWLSLFEAGAHQFLGDSSAAERGYLTVAQAAADAGDVRTETHAWGCLGVLYRELKRFDEAWRCLFKAQELATSLKLADRTFQAYFDLFMLAECCGDARREGYLRECARLYPLVQSRMPSVLRFERLNGIASC